MGEKAFAMAGKTIDEIDYFDIYSCFPSAVQIACDELGLAHDDARGLTVTGGLPYFGGPGNNYVMHSIATMMDVLRGNPGKFGLLNASGWLRSHWRKIGDESLRRTTNRRSSMRYIQPSLNLPMAVQLLKPIPSFMVAKGWSARW
jgi:hypothetical protein